MNAKRSWFPFVIPAIISAFAYGISPASAQTFNVKSFGAVGDGVTDDTTALTNAIAAANAQPGSSVFFPPGNYLYSNQLSATSITLFGQHATLTSANTSAFVACIGSGVAVKTLAFSSQTQTGTALALSNASNFSVLSNTFSGFNGPITAISSTDGQFSNNTINLNSGGAGIIMSFMSHIAINNNVIQNGGNSSTGIAISSSNNISATSNSFQSVEVAFEAGSVDTVSCVNNSMQGFLAGFEMGGCQNVTISQNVCNGRSSTAAGVLIGGCTTALVTQNKISNVDLAVTVGGSTNLTISSNVINGTQSQGMLLGGVTTVSVQRNTITNCGLTGIVGGGLTNSSIDGNSISHCGNQGILNTGASGTESITNNSLADCGLSTTNPAAVIFVNSASATSIPIQRNTYKGNTTNLQYFIWCAQLQPPASISGNLTNTFLPIHIGP